VNCRQVGAAGDRKPRTPMPDPGARASATELPRWLADCRERCHVLLPPRAASRLEPDLHGLTAAPTPQEAGRRHLRVPRQRLRAGREPTPRCLLSDRETGVRAAERRCGERNDRNHGQPPMGPDFGHLDRQQTTVRVSAVARRRSSARLKHDSSGWAGEACRPIAAPFGGSAPATSAASGCSGR
jgi:hypothetical protein